VWFFFGCVQIGIGVLYTTAVLFGCLLFRFRSVWFGGGGRRGCHDSLDGVWYVEVVVGGGYEVVVVPTKY
jgi:hypothetical protein